MNKYVKASLSFMVAIATFAMYFLVPFSFDLTPVAMTSVPGQRCVFLASVKGGVGKITMSASMNGSSVPLEPEKILPQQVSEIMVIPNESGNLTLVVQAERWGLKESKTAIIQVLTVDNGEPGNGKDPLGEIAAEIRDQFVPWLSTQHPELGITDQTKWEGTIVRPNFQVVMFYLFFSEEWEMGVSWHVTIPPHNWARIYLRQRYTETNPSRAYEIASWSEPDEPHSIKLIEAFAEKIWR